MTCLYLGATAETGPEALAPIGECLSAAFRLPVRQVELPDVEFAFDRERGQYASIPVLEMLARIHPGGGGKLMGVTGRDLFIPVLTFVFGHAQLGGSVALVSLARLRQEFYGLERNHEVFLERARKEALHEAGHTFGLVHCAERSCAMSLSTNVQQIDRKRACFCAAGRGATRRR